MHDDELLAAYVGPSWEHHYRASFTVADGQKRRFRFNWAAALVPMWLAWRHFWLFQLALILVYPVLIIGVASLLDWESNVLASALTVIGVAILEGASGDRLVHQRAMRVIQRVRTQGLAPDAELAAVRRAGSGSAVGVAVPAAILLLLGLGVQRLFRHEVDAPYRAAMKSDLRNLVTAEEAYFADSATYTHTPDLSSSYGVTFTLGRVTKTGWSATATHTDTDLVCGIFIGTELAPVQGGKEGEPLCERRPH